MKAIINIQDPVLGSWHQITVEHASNPLDHDKFHMRLDGTTLPADFELNQRIHMMVGAWEDEFEGVTGKETYCDHDNRKP